MISQDRLKLAFVIGSHRTPSQSAKVGRFARDQFLQGGPGREAFYLDLGETPLPLWDEGVWNGAESWQATWGPVSQELSDADGLVLVTPEWGGMATPAMKNFLVLCSDGCVRHRPVLVVSVSSGMGGSYPVAELRMNSSKNSHLCFIPEHIIVRNVAQVLNEGAAPGSDEDLYLRERMFYASNVLIEYARAMKPLRVRPGMFEKRFRYGM
ncbi:NADPH-dependent FMN reductase [Corallococcus terminator]|uniref:NADPH-dependent oxidoreductase n=1 Tax=Corallococcus terminator TaxID=2316733 RepID=A0A3A8IM20_9BACT|nr:NAD(P)H-dependent oxidoreductase [Corallococcus terminator]RKG83516.1 NADPH-dependent oxidoreductase [Corallococcus terminator]